MRASMKAIWAIATALLCVLVNSDTSSAVVQPTSPLQENPQGPLHFEDEHLKEKCALRWDDPPIGGNVTAGDDIKYTVGGNATLLSIVCLKDEVSLYSIQVKPIDGTLLYDFDPEENELAAKAGPQIVDVTLTETDLEAILKFPIDDVSMRDGNYRVTSRNLAMKVKPTESFLIIQGQFNSDFFLVGSEDQAVIVKSRVSGGNRKGPQRGLTQMVAANLAQVMPR